MRSPKGTSFLIKDILAENNLNDIESSNRKLENVPNEQNYGKENILAAPGNSNNLQTPNLLTLEELKKSYLQFNSSQSANFSLGINFSQESLGLHAFPAWLSLAAVTALSLSVSNSCDSLATRTPCLTKTEG